MSTALFPLIPPPRSHFVRWGGVFSPNSPYRKEITLRPEIKKGFQFAEKGEGEKTDKNRTGSKMLARKHLGVSLEGKYFWL